MGLVLLDLTFRVERTFGVQMPWNWDERLGIFKAGDDVTLAQYHQYVLELCRSQGVGPPADSWRVLIGVVEDASGLDAADLGPETRMIRDVAPAG